MLGSLTQRRTDHESALTTNNLTRAGLSPLEQPDSIAPAANGPINASYTSLAREPTTQVLAATSHTLVTQQTGSPAAPLQDVVMSWAGGARGMPENADAPISVAGSPNELPPRCLFRQVVCPGVYDADETWAATILRACACLMSQMRQSPR